MVEGRGVDLDGNESPRQNVNGGPVDWSVVKIESQSRVTVS